MSRKAPTPDCRRKLNPNVFDAEVFAFFVSMPVHARPCLSMPVPGLPESFPRASRGLLMGKTLFRLLERTNRRRLSAEPRGGARGRDRRGPGGRPAARELLDVALIFGDDWQTTNGFKRINDTTWDRGAHCGGSDGGGGRKFVRGTVSGEATATAAATANAAASAGATFRTRTAP